MNPVSHVIWQCVHTQASQADTHEIASSGNTPETHLKPTSLPLAFAKALNGRTPEGCGDSEPVA